MRGINSPSGTSSWSISINRFFGTAVGVLFALLFSNLVELFVNDGAKWSLYAAQITIIAFWSFCSSLPRADASMMSYMWDVAIYTVPVLMFANNKLMLAPESGSVYSIDPTQSLRRWEERINTTESEGSVTLPPVTIQPILWKMITTLENEGDENAGKLIVAGLSVSVWLKANAGTQSTINAVVQRTLDTIIAIVVTVFIDILVFPIDLRRQIRATNTRVWDTARSFLSMWSQAMRTEELMEERMGSFYDSFPLTIEEEGSKNWTDLTGGNTTRVSRRRSETDAGHYSASTMKEARQRSSSTNSIQSYKSTETMKIGIRRSSHNTVDTAEADKRNPRLRKYHNRSTVRMEANTSDLGVGEGSSTLS